MWGVGFRAVLSSFCIFSVLIFVSYFKEFGQIYELRNLDFAIFVSKANL